MSDLRKDENALTFLRFPRKLKNRLNTSLYTRGIARFLLVSIIGFMESYSINSTITYFLKISVKQERRKLSPMIVTNFHFKPLKKI